MSNIEWFKSAKYGMMVHFGIYSMLEGTYRGKRGSNYAEWIAANTRIGNGLGDYVSCGDNVLPDKYTEGLMESPVTFNKTWGYKSFDNEWKSAAQVLEIMRKCNDKGANLLLNVGPDRLGRILAPSVDILRQVGKALKSE